MCNVGAAGSQLGTPFLPIFCTLTNMRHPPIPGLGNSKNYVFGTPAQEL